MLGAAVGWRRGAVVGRAGMAAGGVVRALSVMAVFSGGQTIPKSLAATATMRALSNENRSGFSHLRNMPRRNMYLRNVYPRNRVAGSLKKTVCACGSTSPMVKSTCKPFWSESLDVFCNQRVSG